MTPLFSFATSRERRETPQSPVRQALFASLVATGLAVSLTVPGAEYAIAEEVVDDPAPTDQPGGGNTGGEDEATVTPTAEPTTAQPTEIPQPTAPNTILPAPQTTAEPTAKPTTVPGPAQTVIPEGPATGPAVVRGKVPTWDQVGAASGNTVAANELMSSIRAQIEQLRVAVAEASEASEQAGIAYARARTNAENARSDAMKLEAQITDAQKMADDSAAALGAMAAQLRHHTDGFDPAAIAFFNDRPESNFLQQWTMINRLSTSENSLLERANADRANLEKLRLQCAQKLVDAQKYEKQAAADRDAALAAQMHLQAQQEAAIKSEAELSQMLAVLSDGRAPTESDMQAVMQAQQSAYEAAFTNLEAAGITSQQGQASALGAFAPIVGAQVTDRFGMRVHPIDRTVKMHWGTDYVASCGTPLYSVLNGTVIFAGPSGSYGNLVQIKLDDGTIITYAHIANGGIGVRAGQKVTAGQPIALVGTTGASTGCHLHFEVESAGAKIDPHAWLKSLKVAS